MRFDSNSSISERMVKRSSLEVGVRASSSGRVSSEPSMNFEGRMGEADGDDIVRGGGGSLGDFV